MASLHCHKPEEETLSVSRKACSETLYSGNEVAKTEVLCVETQSEFVGQAHGRKHVGQAHGHLGHRRQGEHKKKGLFERIKDGLAGHSSDSSSSESESDDEKKHTGQRKSY